MPLLHKSIDIFYVLDFCHRRCRTADMDSSFVWLWNVRFLRVPVGSPSRGGDVAVYVFDIKPTELAYTFCFILFLCLCLSLWPFQLYFTP